MGLIIKNAVNRHYSKDIERGIFLEDESNTVFQLNIATNYPSAPSITNDFLNENLLALWNSLNQEIDLQNGDITSFNSYYELLRKTVHSQIYTNNQKNLNIEAIKLDNRMIKAAATVQQRANEAFRERCVRFLAQLHCYNRSYLSFDLKDSTSLDEHRKVIDKLNAYEPSKKALARAIDKVENVYADAGLFKSSAYSSQDAPPL